VSNKEDRGGAADGQRVDVGGGEDEGRLSDCRLAGDESRSSPANRIGAGWTGCEQIAVAEEERYSEQTVHWRRKNTGDRVHLWVADLPFVRT
jgi:hypothetical protein